MINSFREKIVIPKTLPFITFLGDATNLSVISWNDSSSTIGSDGHPLGTFNTPTVAVNADYFIAINITFENSASYFGKKVEQAVALRISGNKAAFYGCSFFGVQDTLYDHKEALSSIQLQNTRRVILLIGPGVYREKIVIPKTLPFITFLGDATNLSVISWNDSSSTIGSDGHPLGTFNTPTVAVNADYFIAINITFENSASYFGKKVEQAVALRISGNKAAFYGCSFFGVQDTLYDHKGYITAQKRSSSSLDTGFSFKKCEVKGSGHIYLGRPWGEYSRVIYSYTNMKEIVLPKGWEDTMNGTHYPNTIYYGEYKCSGPGSNFSGRAPWARNLTDEEAQPFLEIHFIEGETWLINPN
ncbi:hypothetical protein KIW84_012254 [Lathyrus oleraceus]|uniref:pectinesterase n=1 Tax=Pisum sativum TaxID=3888 RepID=A0A9D5GW08_PEA|nr:hypothetical protein KIW84_012254 [Pisum sativum]